MNLEILNMWSSPISYFPEKSFRASLREALSSILTLWLPHRVDEVHDHDNCQVTVAKLLKSELLGPEVRIIPISPFTF
jgi:hypothetical protein